MIFREQNNILKQYSDGAKLNIKDNLSMWKKCDYLYDCNQLGGWMKCELMEKHFKSEDAIYICL